MTDDAIYNSAEELVEMFPVLQNEPMKEDGLKRFSFIDKSITKDNLFIFSTLQGTNYLEYTLHTDSMFVQLCIYPLDKSLNHAIMTMEWDFGLSDASCVSLYENNFVIRYKNSDSIPMAIYDRQAIMRRHTIKEIIKC